MKLLIEPEHGAEALLAAIREAKKSIELVIFRFDRVEIEAELRAAVGRGVAVSALIAYTNRGGEGNLRRLEMRLLEDGVAVSRTANDLSRYHDKFVIIDRRLLFLLSFNFTHLDIDYSRGFGIETRNVKLVHEASRLFEADSTRKPFTSHTDALVVSPVNSRKTLSRFIKGARRELLIYDPKVADLAMLRALAERRAAGVHIRVIGHVGKVGKSFHARRMLKLRLHTRTIIRDGRHAFLGSQSLRTAELDSRREVGLILSDKAVVAGLKKTFEADWLAGADGVDGPGRVTAKAIKKAEKGLVKELSRLNPIVKAAIKEARSESREGHLTVEETKASVREAVKAAVRETVKVRVDEAVRKAEGHVRR